MSRMRLPRHMPLGALPGAVALALLTALPALLPPGAAGTADRADRADRADTVTAAPVQRSELALAASRTGGVVDHWGDSRVVEDRGVVVHGRVRGAHRGRLVVLQRRTSHGWVRVRRTRTGHDLHGRRIRARHYALRVPTSFPSRRTYRLVAPVNRWERAHGDRWKRSAAHRVVVYAGVVAHWGDATVTEGSRVLVSGRVRGAHRGRLVLLERHTRHGWVRVRGTRTGHDLHGNRILSRRYVLRVPTGHVGRPLYRLRAPGGPGVRTKLSWHHRQRVRAALTASSDNATTASGDPRDYGFMFGSPSPRWNPCRRIGYRVHLAGSPDGALADTRKAVRRIEGATGLDLVYRGRTRIVPQRGYSRNYPDDTDIVIAWARPGQSNMITADLAGVGGPVASTGYYDEDGDAARAFIQGAVVLNRRMNDRLDAGFGYGATVGELVMHELGHVVGLNHADGKAEIMYPQLQPAPARWGAGDLTGLHRLGKAQGCLRHRR